MLSGILQALLPEKMQTKHMERLCAVALMLMIVIPLFQLDGDTFLELFGAFESQEADASVSDDPLQKVVEAKTAEMIQKKGESLGMKLSVTVEAKKEDDVPYPERVILSGTYSAEQKKTLSLFMETELGIEGANQIWES